MTVRTVLSDVAQIRAPGRPVYVPVFLLRGKWGHHTILLEMTRDCLYTVEIAACLCFYSGGIVITARIVIICVRYYWKVCREHGVEFSSLDDIHEDTKSLNVVFMGLVLDVV